MEKHLFKVIYSNEDDVYRILDLTDTSIVGITEMYETDDEIERKWRVEKTKAIKEKKELGAKVKGYGIFIVLDENNTSAQQKSQDDYLRSVLRQMAVCFETEVINEDPRNFIDYYVPQGQRYPANPGEKTVSSSVITPADKKSKKNKKNTKFPLWARVILIIIGIALLGLIGAFVSKAILLVLCLLAFIPEIFEKR